MTRRRTIHPAFERAPMVLALAAWLAVPATAHGQEMKVNTHRQGAQEAVDVAMDASGDAVAVWRSAPIDGLRGRLLGADATPRGTEFTVSPSAQSAVGEPSVAMAADGGFVVAWSAEAGGTSGVFAQRFHPDGSPVGQPNIVASDTNVSFVTRPRVAMDDQGDYAVMWGLYSEAAPPRVLFQRYGADDAPRGAKVDVRMDGKLDAPFEPELDMAADGSFVVVGQVYDETAHLQGIRARRYRADGTAQGRSMVVTQAAGSFADSANVAVTPKGGFVVTWAHGGGGGGDVVAKGYARNGAVRFDEVALGGDVAEVGARPDVAVAKDGSAAVTWATLHGLEIRRVSTAGVAGTPATFTVNGADTTPAIGLDGSGKGLVAFQRDLGNDDPQSLEIRSVQVPPP